jgi:hypothetical protein
MAKRFPVPEFDYEELKGRPWSAPRLLTLAEADALVQRARDGDAQAHGAYPVAVSDEYFDALGVRGEGRHAVLCVLPLVGTRVMGRSHAWKLQRVVATDGTAPASMRIVFDWKTTRPMNTRLGPDDRLEVGGPALYLVSGNRFRDYWVPNRTLVDTEWSPADGEGYRVLGCDDHDLNDFHAAAVTVQYGG